LGYQTVFLTDPRQAIEVVRQDPGGFDLVLMDMVMPGMGGAQCLRELKALCPRLPVLVTTGYAEEGAMERMRAAGAAGFLAKPYTRDQLAEALRRALSA
ncbi:MAG: response regulator, partial [Bryobacteraceae bacterium]